MNRENQLSLNAFLDREADVRKLARENAKIELPATDSLTPDKTHTYLKSDAEVLVTKIIADTEATLAKLASEMKKQEQIVFSNEHRVTLDSECENCRAGIISIIDSSKNKLLKLKESCLQAQKYLEIFKREHNINREPKHPPSKQAHYLWIFFYGIVEIIANIFFFNIGFSAIDSMLIAFALTCLNLLISIAAGNFARQISATGAKRVFAYSMTFLWLIFVIWFNTGTALSRSIMMTGDASALSGAAGHAFKEAWQIFLFVAPNIQDFMSILLWIAGAAVGGFAFFEGYRSEDPILGYTDHCYAAERSRNLYDEAESEFRKKADQIIAQALPRFDSLRTLTSNALTQFNATHIMLLDEAKQSVIDLNSVQAAYARLVNAYREENRYRASLSPAYFAIQPLLDIPEVKIPEHCSEEEISRRATNLQEVCQFRLAELAEYKKDYIKNISELARLINEELLTLDRKARENLQATAKIGGMN